MRRAALAVLALLVLAGCSAAPEVDYAPNGTAFENAAGGTPAPAPVLTAEDLYIADILDTPGLTSDMDGETMIGLGEGACDVMAYQQYPRTELVAALGMSRLGPEVMGVIVDAAQRNLCPQYQFPVAAAAPVIPDGTFTSGTYEVGVDIQPGKYRSPGGDGCYWARLGEDQTDILDNNLGDGPSVFTVRESDGYVELNRCTWTLAE